MEQYKSEKNGLCKMQFIFFTKSSDLVIAKMQKNSYY